MTTAARPAPAALTDALATIRGRVDGYLERMFEALPDELGIDPDRFPLELLREFALADGKRIRPAFVHWGYLAAGGHVDDRDDDDGPVGAGAALELLHAFALVHDDVMDASALRRGRPTMHVAFAEEHRARGLRGERRRYGESLAILLGDLAQMLSARLAANLPPAARRIYHRTACDLVQGQHLDIETAASGCSDAATAERLVRMKTTSYTVEGPLLIGAALGPHGADAEESLRAYGRAVGEVFQHRDDLLDVFGEPGDTGKPVGGDIAEQKMTRLTGILRERTGETPAPTCLDGVRELLRCSGALDELCAHMDTLTGAALDALTAAPIPPDVRVTLAEAARFAGNRGR